ncbi:penicillin-binding protein [Clostridium tagluense]|uniref:penicillin-binding transpeptidase domain-containing protein n=1 Tax=Clostridium tagluense TaxID=360422 RepID=UPI001C0AA6A0|nr:penicillin-binding transpeptidase domain-containing protein [Clostridium tagluense]MBU3128396.1 penicillin-binding protein [Clostridium tagluense]MCB2313170.1 penicillin-binding protein [Clostridium tagluense]MCB2317936.1 penicillin-binding protein [Clostridium tagluense]MCB2322752.1 penicillin-binding protein [Clostridium tagluense]MCB2327750.1 penicillin-binding protein [Clostridium tagluense]
MSKKNKNKNEFSRFNVLVVIMILIFSAIIWRLVNIQVINGELYRETANQQNHKMISTVAPRGDIIDRNGKKLAESKQSYILTFTKTQESEDSFFPTMDNVFKTLDANKTIQIDDFLLKIKTSEDKKSTEYSFDFGKTLDKTTQNWIELRFKKDRGFEEIVIKKLYKDKKKDDLTDEQKKKVDEDILKITPKEVYNELIKQYGMNEIKDSKSKELLRRYMLVKDTLKMQSFSGYKPITIANNLSKDVAGIFEQMQPEIPGISVTTQPIRVYPGKDLGSAFLGYISKINPWDTDKYEEQGYDISSDYIGTSGIEAAFEDVLRGTKGQESIAVNKQGRKVSTLGQIETYPGQTIQLNIDKNMQYAAEKSLDAVMLGLQKAGKNTGQSVDTTNANRGAVVVLDVNTGKVLALASRPGYDPNLFSISGSSTSEINNLLNPNIAGMGLKYIQDRGLANITGVLSDKDMAEKSKAERENILLNYMFPLDKSVAGNTTIRKDNNDIFPKATFNYSTKSLIPPGSTFKPLTAIAGLEEGVIEQDSTVNDEGPYNKRYPSLTAACWKFNEQGYGHGWVDLRKAMRESCNYYFYDVADKLFAKAGENKAGLDLLAKYAWKFGLGIDPTSNAKPATGIEIPENFGQVYNYQSSKEILANIHISNLVGFLQKGINSTGSKYKPLDTVSQKESGTKDQIQEIKKVNEKKLKFQAFLKTEMKKEKISSENSIIKSSKISIKEVIEASKTLKNNNYTDRDISAMAETIYSEINNANTEINSAANAYYAAIGQGFNAFTPLQLANFVSTMVNGGNRYETHLVDKFLDPDGNIIKEIKPVVLEKTNVSSKTIDSIKEGMLEVTSDINGTAYSVFKDFPIQSGGKTGSATFNDLTQTALGRTSYGYYIGFAPYDKPKIAVCAVVFDGGHGGWVAPVAKAVYEQYFKAELLKLDPKYKFMVNPDENTSNIDLNTDVTGNGHD